MENILPFWEPPVKGTLSRTGFPTWEAQADRGGQQSEEVSKQLMTRSLWGKKQNKTKPLNEATSAFPSAVLVCAGGKTGPPSAVLRLPTRDSEPRGARFHRTGFSPHRKSETRNRVFKKRKGSPARLNWDLMEGGRRTCQSLSILKFMRTAGGMMPTLSSACFAITPLSKAKRMNLKKSQE